MSEKRCDAVSPHSGTRCKLEEGHYHRLVHMADGPEMTEAWEDEAGRAASADPRVLALRKRADERYPWDQRESTDLHRQAAELRGKIRDEILRKREVENMENVGMPFGGAPFRPGKYEHYKGGHYSAIMLVAHHETREPMVVYVSQEKGNVQVRELRQPPFGPGGRPQGGLVREVDAWTDVVEWPDGEKRPRFSFEQDFK